MQVHKHILIGAYVALGVYVGIRMLLSYEAALNTQLSVFYPGVLYAYLIFTLIALAPISCFFIAVALQKGIHGGFLVLPALHAAVVVTLYGPILAIYISGWYVARTRASAP